MTVYVYPTLTEREFEILKLKADGLLNKEIADRLTPTVSDQTVKNHITSILQKFNANSSLEAVVKAMRMGIIQ